MTQTTRGILAMIGACTVWGLSSIYYKQLADVPPLTILAHRTLWSMVFFALVLTGQGKFGQLISALRDRRSLMIIAGASLMISVNWYFFIYSVSIGHATQASLGYYIFPLVAVVLGRIVFGERLGPMQMAAVLLAAIAVALLTWGLGVAPWISLTLAFSFGLYGVLKKWLDVGPVVSVTAEVVLIAPISLFVLWHGGLAMDTPSRTAMLVFSGPLTGLPLIMFSYASRRIPMATMGLLQYMNPTLQFLVAVLLFREPFGIWYAVAFGMIWTALAIYTAAGFNAASRRRKTASSTVSTTVTNSSVEAPANP
ncbi:EamA family transporter RarD [Donghicola sp. C2-DW-16]|uniref:EamA family transporter RarD n=1 Tax=Donghicola mangrovi TaxID=2729614 RepID=A0ABX2PEV2_9RHOB|nr:EamA family transporter RarD [Donghicola mangrovi]NVO27710.1 EamA family transporter RarD [Donghicola mangrovi]